MRVRSSERSTDSLSALSFVFYKSPTHIVSVNKPSGSIILQPSLNLLTNVEMILHVFP